MQQLWLGDRDSLGSPGDGTEFKPQNGQYDTVIWPEIPVIRCYKSVSHPIYGLNTPIKTTIKSTGNWLYCASKSLWPPPLGRFMDLGATTSFYEDITNINGIYNHKIVCVFMCLSESLG